MHVVIVGGGAALAQPIADFYGGNEVTLLKRGEHSIDRCDVFISCIGKNISCKLEDMGENEEWGPVIRDNLSAVAHSIKRCPLRMPEGGNVVILGSIVGSTGAYGAAAYSAAKAGLVGLVRSAALEWASKGIMVNLLELGYIDAGMGARLPEKVKQRALESIPLRRFGTAEDVVQAVDYLARTKYMTGGVLTLAGGLR